MLLYKPFLPLLALCASVAPVDAKPTALTPSDGPSSAKPADGAPDGISVTDAGPASFTLSELADFSPCSDWYSWYGNGRWTYVEVQFCFQQTINSTIAVVTQKNGQYYWGGAWYRAGKWGMSWTISTTVQGVEDFQGSATTSGGTGTDKYHTLLKKTPPGAYAVSLTYDQTGPYWGNDTDIHEAASFAIVLS